jgi:thioredoxin 1
MGNFKELISQDKPVLVDFFATWCGPCKTMSPILEDLKKDLGEEITIIKIDVDKNPKASEVYKVQSVPTLILFKKGEIKWRQAGVVPKQQIKQVIANLSK